MNLAMATTNTTGPRIGYIRVWTVAQTLDQQQAALEAAGVTKFFSDNMSDAVTTGQASLS